MPGTIKTSLPKTIIEYGNRAKQPTVFQHRKETALWWRILLPIFVVVIIAATFFAKQHSVLDAMAALPLCLIGEALIYWFKVLK